MDRKLSRKEKAALQRTQVLNLKEFEEVARFEKRTSRKPAVLFAVLGFLLIAFGMAFQMKDSLTSREAAKVEKRKVSKEVVTTPKETSLECTLTNLNNADGTDTVYTIDYHFLDQKLTGFTKMFTATATVGAELGPVSIQNYLNAYPAFLNPIEGYQISAVPIVNGVVVTVIVDFDTLDLLKLNPKQQEHFSTSIDYPLDTELGQIQQEMFAGGFQCQ